MATRKQIREPFYSELETAVSGLVTSDNIGEEFPSDEEELPAVVHRDDYRRNQLNTNTGIKDTVTDSDGVQEEIRSRLMQGRFTLTAVSDDEAEKEDIYEAIRSHFEVYEFPNKAADSLQSDVNRIWVTDSNSTDDEDREPTLRGDQLIVFVEYERIIGRDVDPAKEVNTNVDADNDGTDDISLTTTTTN